MLRATLILFIFLLTCIYCFSSINVLGCKYLTVKFPIPFGFVLVSMIIIMSDLIKLGLSLALGLCVYCA